MHQRSSKSPKVTADSLMAEADDGIKLRRGVQQMIRNQGLMRMEYREAET